MRDYNFWILMGVFFIGFCYLYIVVERAESNSKSDREKRYSELNNKLEKLAARQIALTKAKHVHLYLHDKEVAKPKGKGLGRGLDTLIDNKEH